MLKQLFLALKFFKISHQLTSILEGGGQRCSSWVHQSSLFPDYQRYSHKISHAKICDCVVVCTFRFHSLAFFSFFSALSLPLIHFCPISFAKRPSNFTPFRIDSERGIIFQKPFFLFSD